jgi:hypothetical protein
VVGQLVKVNGWGTADAEVYLEAVFEPGRRGADMS